jgi:hypothetical protein
MSSEPSEIEIEKTVPIEDLVKEEIDEPEENFIKPKKPRTEKQIEAFNKMKEKNELKQKEKKELKRIEEEKIKQENDLKILKKAIALNKKNIKKHKIISEVLEIDEGEDDLVDKISKVHITKPDPVIEEPIKEEPKKDLFVVLKNNKKRIKLL